MNFFKLLLFKSKFFKRMLIYVAEEKAKQPSNEIWCWMFDTVGHGFYTIFENHLFNSDEKPNVSDAGRDIFGNVYIWKQDGWIPFTNDMELYSNLLPFSKEATKITLEKHFKNENETTKMVQNRVVNEAVEK